MKQTIAIASDHAGFPLKERLRSYLSGRGLKVQDLGTYSEDRCAYPTFAYILAKGVACRKFKRGILICKSGIGHSIVANRFPGVRAALCYNVKAAKLSRQHNDSNVLVLGSAFVDAVLAKRMIKVWLNTKFKGGRHRRRLDILKGIEREIRG
ncbi:MAG: ribose 5-phosphate isomerase B [Candidatus Omnitrophota bacterium]